MAGASAILAIKIIADATQAAKTFGKTGKDIGKFEKGIQSAALPAAAIVAGLGAMTVAASEDAAETAALTKVYANATGSTEDYSSAIDAAIAAGQDKAFTDSEVRAGLKPLIASTGDAEEANALLAKAFDLSRYAGVDLETASKALAKANEGSATALGKLVPGLEKTKDPLKAMAQATELAAGAADTYAATGPGQLAKVADSYGEIGESIGTSFLPVLSIMADLLQDVSRFLNEHMDIIKPLAVIVGGFAAAVLAVNAALAIYHAIVPLVTAVQWLLNAAMAANPIMLIVIAIGLLVAGFILAYQHSEEFRRIVDAAFKAVSDAVKGAVDTVRNVLGQLGRIFESAFAAVRDAVRGAVGFIRSVWDGVLSILETPLRLFGKVVDIVFAAARLVVSLAILAVRTIFSTLAAALEAPFRAFQTLVATVFAAVKRTITDAVAIVRGIFATIAAWLAAPWAALQTKVASVFAVIKGIITGAISAVSSIFAKVDEMLTAPFKALESTVRRIMGAVVGAVRNAVNTIEGILDGIRGAIQSVQNAVDRVTPGMAPAPAGAARALPSAQARGARRIPGAGGPAGSFTVNVYGGDPWKVEQAIARGYRRWTMNQGMTAPSRAW